MSMPKLLRIKPLDAYPIGSIYMSLDSISPADIFGGVWERLKDKFLMPAGDTYVANSTGGSAEQTLLIENMPAHTHTRGTMNITGELRYNRTYAGTPYSSGGMIGAFTYSDSSAQEYYVSGRSTGSGWPDNIVFDASRTWSGETSSEGGGRAFRLYPLILLYTHGKEYLEGFAFRK